MQPYPHFSPTHGLTHEKMRVRCIFFFVISNCKDKKNMIQHKQKITTIKFLAKPFLRTHEAKARQPSLICTSIGTFTVFCSCLIL